MSAPTDPQRSRTTELSTSEVPPDLLLVRKRNPGLGGNSEQHKNDRQPSSAGKPVSREMDEIGRRGQRFDIASGIDVDPFTGRLLSIAQLQAVLRAQGVEITEFPGQEPIPGTAPLPLAACLPEAARRIEDAVLLPGNARSWLVSDLTHRAPHGWVAILGVHPGAGASTIALAIADAAALTGTPVHLLQAGQPGYPAGGGLAAVTHDELGVIDGGWRRGRRGLVTVDRPTATETRSWPPPPDLSSASRVLTLVDAGAADTAAGGEFPGLLASWWVPGTNSPSAVVLVCRASGPGITATEQLLHRLHDHLETARLTRSRHGTPQVLVATVGGSRWHGPVRAASGPHLNELRQRHRLVGVPHVRQLELTGASADPLPRSVLAAGRTLWTLATGGPQTREGGRR